MVNTHPCGACTLNNASDQKVVIDKVFKHNRSLIVEDSTDQLLLFVTGGAGVGSFLIRRNAHQNTTAP